MTNVEIQKIPIPKRCHRCGDEILFPGGIILKILSRPDPIRLCPKCHGEFIYWFSTGEKQPNTRPTHSAHRTFDKNGVIAFIRARIRPDPTGIVTKEKLYRRYRQYCTTHNHTVLTREAFSKAILKQIPTLTSTRRRIDGTRHHHWAGIMDKRDS